MRDIGIGFRSYEDFMNFVFLYLHPCKYSYMKYLLLLMVLFYSVNSHSAEGIYLCNIKKAYTIQDAGNRSGVQANFPFIFEWKNDEIYIKAGGDNFIYKTYKIVSKYTETFFAINYSDYDSGGGVLEIPIIPIECILKYNILYNKHNIYREA